MNDILVIQNKHLKVIISLHCCNGLHRKRVSKISREALLRETTARGNVERRTLER